MKALPLFFVDIVVKNCVMKKCDNVMGIQVDTQPCVYQRDNLRDKMNAHCVTRQSCPYIGGKKYFTFNKGDVIMKVDGKEFNQNFMLWSDIMGMRVPLNTYMMLKVNNDPMTPIAIKIMRQYHNTPNIPKIRIYRYNLVPIPYNDMFCTRIHTKIYEWKGLIFMDLSEEIIEFYRRMGMHIINGFSQNDKYALNNEKIVILFNYNKNITSNQRDLVCSIPYHGESGEYFYVVNFIDKKKIINLEKLKTILHSTLQTIKNKNVINNSNKRLNLVNKVTIKISNDIDIMKSLNICI